MQKRERGGWESKDVTVDTHLLFFTIKFIPNKEEHTWRPSCPVSEVSEKEIHPTIPSTSYSLCQRDQVEREKEKYTSASLKFTSYQIEAVTWVNRVTLSLSLVLVLFFFLFFQAANRLMVGDASYFLGCFMDANNGCMADGRWFTSPFFIPHPPKYTQPYEVRSTEAARERKK